MSINTSKKIEKTAKNIDEARAAAALELGVSEDALQIEVLENATQGFLGMGAKPCKILAWVDEESAVERAEEFLTRVIRLMGIDATVKATEDEESLNIDISGEKMGVIIGRRGETLDALQYLTRIIVNKGDQEYKRVVVDTENYREKRTEVLKKLANKVADKVSRSGRSVTLEPMNPFERRVIHSALQDREDVYTVSVGEDTERRVVVSSSKKDKKRA